MENNKDWFVYLLRCKDNSLYCGITNNLDKRVQQHNKGKASKYTRVRLPVVLVYYELGYDKNSALKREIIIKRYRKSEKEVLISLFNQ